MNQVERILNDLEKLKHLLDLEYQGFQNNINTRNYALKAFNFASTLQLAIQLIKSYQLQAKLAIEEIQQANDRIKQLEAKEFKPLLNDKRNDFIDYLIQELEDLKINE